MAEQLRDMLLPLLFHASCLGTIERPDSVIAYFPPDCDRDGITAALDIAYELIGPDQDHAPFSIAWKIVPDQDWNENWKKNFNPIRVGSAFTILPPWEARDPGRMNLVIDPAMAFGTGHHETTRSCLILMERYAPQCGHGSMLDVGTGTGILAIAARMIGFNRVVGIDTDRLAIEAAGRNCALNNISDIQLHEGAITAVQGPFNLVVANIVSSVLIQLASDIRRLLMPDSIAILSGNLRGQDHEVIAAMEGCGLQLIERYPDGKWITLAFSANTSALR